MTASMSLQDVNMVNTAVVGKNYAERPFAKCLNVLRPLELVSEYVLQLAVDGGDGLTLDDGVCCCCIFRTQNQYWWRKV